ncbi:MAG TPA: hypothetical protein VFE78_12820 [Gemmataceae bacterium]|nr:hypothetical protein [Gemmataceae bacterium]
MPSILPLLATDYWLPPTFALVGEAGNAILFMMSLLATLVIALAVVSYAGHCFLTVLQDTAAGIDRVMWPEEPTADWLLRSVRVTGLLVLWLVPAGFLARGLQPALAPGNAPLSFLILAVSGLWLFFPVGVLSAFSATTFWTPIRPSVVAKMLRVFPATAGFYLITAALGLGVTALWYHALFGTLVWLLPVAAAATAAAILIYARLLGRVAWLMARLPERKAKAAAPRQEKSGAKRRPKKLLKNRKTIRKATRASDPWAVPKGELPVEAPNLPADGYEVADDDGPRPNPPPKSTHKKYYEPPSALEIERYEVDLSPAQPRPADETPLDGYDPVDVPRLPPEERSLAQDAARLGSEVAHFENRLTLQREDEYVPARPLWSSVWGFPWYETSMGAWFVLTLGSVALGVGFKAMVQFFPFK